MRTSALFAGIGIVSVGAVGAALVSQHAFGMQPCPWCVLQRVIFLAIALAVCAGLIWRTRSGRLSATLLTLMLALSGVAAALWQHFQGAASSSCNQTLADRIVSGWLGLDTLWPDAFSARASCADAAVALFGIPYEFWSAAVFAGIAIATVVILRRAQ